MKRIFVPTQSGADWQHLLGKPKLHWKMGRSAMSAAACWEDAHPNLPAEVVQILGASKDPQLTDLELLVAIPEWKVDLPGGKRPSQTDVLVLARNANNLAILGVEAKVDETFGPTIGKKKLPVPQTNLSASHILRESWAALNHSRTQFDISFCTDQFRPYSQPEHFTLQSR